MDCKIDHTLDGAIPLALCCVCSPRPATAARYADVNAHMPDGSLSASRFVAGCDLLDQPATGATGPDSHYDRKVKRKLKAEVKHWRERVEYLEGHSITSRTLTRARDILRKAETDLYMVL